jgi:hypothetical protein
MVFGHLRSPAWLLTIAGRLVIEDEDNREVEEPPEETTCQGSWMLPLCPPDAKPNRNPWHKNQK